MAANGDKIQALMDEVYAELRKEENRSKGKWDVLADFSEAHQIAVVFGNFNYQVENGGIEQWVYNGYFHDDSDKLIDFLETGVDLDDRCRAILDRVYKLDHYAKETECDRNGYYRDHGDDGDSSFIGDLMDCNAFDTWYYANCGKDDWWETVNRIIDITQGHDVALSHEAGEPEDTPPHPGNTEIADTQHSFRVYVENANNGFLGGFTMPLPTTADDLRPFLEEIEISSAKDIKIFDAISDSDCLNEAMTEILSKSVTPDALDELNYLAAKINAMNPSEYETFGAALEAKRHCGSVADIINLTDNLSRIDIQPAFDAQQYGAFHVNLARDEYADIMNRLEVSANPVEQDFFLHVADMEMHVDLAAYGQYVAENEGGVFTEHGYLTQIGAFQEVYRGPQDIPAEHRVISPAAQAHETSRSTEKPSVLEQIAAARAERAAAPKRDAPEKPKSREPEL